MPLFSCAWDEGLGHGIVVWLTLGHKVSKADIQIDRCQPVAMIKESITSSWGVKPTTLGLAAGTELGEEPAVVTPVRVWNSYWRKEWPRHPNTEKKQLLYHEHGLARAMTW